MQTTAMWCTGLSSLYLNVSVKNFISVEFTWVNATVKQLQFIIYILLFYIQCVNNV